MSRLIVVCIVSTSMLVACGGDNSETSGNTDNETTLLATTSCGSSWVAGKAYVTGNIVKYLPNGRYYKATHNNPGYDPTISTWYWSAYTCSGSTPPPSNGFVVSAAQFNQMFPNKSSFYTYSGLLTALSHYPSFTAQGTLTQRKQEAAAFLANVAHESDSLKAVREYNTANWPHYCSTEWGNTCAAGQQYYGRGPIQLSWNYNYKAAGNAMGVNLWANPDLVATNAAIAWRTGLWYWYSGTGSAGMTPYQAIYNNYGFGMTIRAINGSLECDGKRPAEVQRRVDFYKRFTGILGVSPGGNLYC